MKPVKILIPLGGRSGWDGNELRYMLRSLEQNCKFDIEVNVYATSMPEWINPVTTNLIFVDRFFPSSGSSTRMYENFFDTLNKLRIFSSENPNENFIYAYDDILLLEPIYSLDYIQNVANESDTPRKYKAREKLRHGRTVNKAIDILKYEGFWSGLIYETHLPRVFNTSEMAFMFKAFNFENDPIPYAPSTLYFNLNKSRASDLPPLSHVNSLRGLFHFDDDHGDAGSVQQIEQEVRGKMWVNYNDKGLKTPAYSNPNIEPLKEWIQDKFPNKSKYEK